VALRRIYVLFALQIETRYVQVDPADIPRTPDHGGRRIPGRRI
jgi:hypothetical protein